MSIVEAHFTVIDRKAVGVLVREVESMFIEFFDYRRLFVKDYRKPKEYATVDLNVSRTEDSIVKAFLAPIMKLSAEGFAPVFYKLHRWAIRGKGDDLPPDDKSAELRLVTFLRLAEQLSHRLKELFEPFASHLFTELVTIVRKFVNLTPETIQDREQKSGQDDTKTFESDSDFVAFIAGMPKSQKPIALKAVLGTLKSCFTFCPPVSFVTNERFEAVVEPLVDQLENRNLNEDEVRDFVMAAIVHFGVALEHASKETMLKKLSELVMLKARHTSAEIRLLAVRCQKQIVLALGREGMISLLVELLPSVAELMEDADEEIEKEAHALLITMEDVTGEKLQKYM
ncbi:unnamed protein product [Notodromas monacha]|uniref:HEAT repeat-containing protein 1 n=1 Tax=Notodromas monacha TaxID=399045 RepID=A0A7R9BUQ3_9CRUS|nr:unnamed protein product [Notodromas monacha]CAG0921732.1 unnamed protein product [Notodromas monacha]